MNGKIYIATQNKIRSISNYVEKRNKLNWDIPKAIANLNIELNKFLNNL